MQKCFSFFCIFSNTICISFIKSILIHVASQLLAFVILSTYSKTFNWKGQCAHESCYALSKSTFGKHNPLRDTMTICSFTSTYLVKHLFATTL